MNFSRGVFIPLVIIILSSPMAWTEEWKQIGESDGIIGYTLRKSESKHQAVMGAGVVDAPVAVVEAVLRDVPALTEFILNCKKSAFVTAPEFENTSDSFHTYMATALPFPAKDRDAIYRTDYTIDKATGTVYVDINGVKSDYKLSKDRVRMPVKVGYILTPRGTDQTEVIYTTVGDPGGAIPNLISDMFTKNLGIKTIAGLRQMVRKDKRRDCRTVITQTPRRSFLKQQLSK